MRNYKVLSYIKRAKELTTRILAAIKAFDTSCTLGIHEVECALVELARHSADGIVVQFVAYII